MEGTNTICFIPNSDVPFTTNKVTYPRLVCDIRPNKAETHRTRLTVVGNLLYYDVTLATPTTKINTAKCLFNSIFSTPNAKCLIADIYKYYLSNDLPQPEYIKIHISIITQEIMNAYNLQEIVDNKLFVYMKICKGMYGLK